MKKKHTHFREYHLEKLKSPRQAKAYLAVALEEFEKDGDKEAFLLALRDVTEAQGGISALAERTKLNRQNLYKALSSKGDPQFRTVGTILHGLGFKLSVEQVRENRAH